MCANTVVFRIYLGIIHLRTICGLYFILLHTGLNLVALAFKPFKETYHLCYGLVHETRARVPYLLGFHRRSWAEFHGRFVHSRIRVSFL